MDITKKVKRPNFKKQELWSLFDKEINEDQLECVYSSTPREYCDLCNSVVKLSDEGFKICSNNKCGIIYKDILDNMQNGDIVDLKIQMQKTLQDAVFLLILLKNPHTDVKFCVKVVLVMK